MTTATLFKQYFDAIDSNNPVNRTYAAWCVQFKFNTITVETALELCNTLTQDEFVQSCDYPENARWFLITIYSYVTENKSKIINWLVKNRGYVRSTSMLEETIPEIKAPEKKTVTRSVRCIDRDGNYYTQTYEEPINNVSNDDDEKELEATIKMLKYMDDQQRAVPVVTNEKDLDNQPKAVPVEKDIVKKDDVKVIDGKKGPERYIDRRGKPTNIYII